LRLGPQDRIPAAADEAPKKSSAKRKTGDADNDAPRERKPRANRGRASARSKGRARSGIYRLVYWGAVLGLWAVIAAVGVIVWVGAHPAGDPALEIPKRAADDPDHSFDGQRAGKPRRKCPAPMFR